jgi:hypothetical protein
MFRPVKGWLKVPVSAKLLMAFVVTVLCRPLRRGFASQRRPIRQSGMQANKIVLVRRSRTGLGMVT